MQPSMHFRFAKETLHKIIGSWEKNVNKITIEQYSIVVPKKKKLHPSKPTFPSTIPVTSIFALQKEVLSHACKPVLGLAFPKWGIPKIWGTHFAMGNFHFEFSKQFKSFLKVSHPFCNGFLSIISSVLQWFVVNISFLQWKLFQTSHPFCNGLFF